MAAIEVVAHVDGENRDVGDGEHRPHDAKRSSEERARPAAVARRDDGGAKKRDDERGEHAHAGRHEVRTQAGEECEPEHTRRRQVSPRFPAVWSATRR